MHLPRAVRCQDDDGRLLGPDRADLGDRDLEIRERLQKEGLERFIRAVHLVDQQDGRPAILRLQRLQERAADEVGVRKELFLQRGAVRGARRLGGPDRDHLPGEVPFVDRARRVRSLRSTATGSACGPARRRSPWRSRSCRHPPRLRERAACRVSATKRRRCPDRARTRNSAARGARSSRQCCLGAPSPVFPLLHGTDIFSRRSVVYRTSCRAG
jgi:hypothetical protein